MIIIHFRLFDDEQQLFYEDFMNTSLADMNFNFFNHKYDRNIYFKSIYLQFTNIKGIKMIRNHAFDKEKDLFQNTFPIFSNIYNS